MRAMGWGESDVGRVVVIGAATAAVMIELMFAKPFYSAMVNTEAPGGADVSKPLQIKGPRLKTCPLSSHPRLTLILNSSSEPVTGATDITPNDQSPGWS